MSFRSGIFAHLNAYPIHATAEIGDLKAQAKQAGQDIKAGAEDLAHKAGLHAQVAEQKIKETVTDAPTGAALYARFAFAGAVCVSMPNMPFAVRLLF